MPVINNIWKIFTETPGLNFNFIVKLSKEEKMDVLKTIFNFLQGEFCTLLYSIYLILFTLCYLSHPGFICHCILYTHFK